jgi:hypothetical protein
MIKSGSFSRLDVFESCKLRAKLAFIDRIREPERPPLPNGKEYANDRGTRVHEACDAFVQGKIDAVPDEAKLFLPELHKLRELHEDGRVYAEEMWCYDFAWEPVDATDWNNTVMRIKTDITVFQSDDQVIIIDFKTGKRFGNEVKHAQQLQLYGVGAVMRYPDVNHVTAELWYFDADELVSMKFERRHAMKFREGWDVRLDKMMSAKEFPASPSRENCRWCPFGPRGTGDCKVGV